MIDFNHLPRFKGFSFLIACQIPHWMKAHDASESEIERQILLAHGWAQNNPRRAPKSDIMRYLDNWMNIADRRGSIRRGISHPRSVREPDPEPDMTIEEMKEIRRRNFPQHGTHAEKFKGAIDTQIVDGKGALK